MKTIRNIFLFAAMLLFCMPANAQLGNLVNRAKNAVQQEVSKKKQQASGAAINALEGNDKGTESKSAQTMAANPAAEQTAPKAAVPSGPEIPELMSKKPANNQYDETGKYFNKLVWGLREMPPKEALALAEKLTARAKWDRQILAQMNDGTLESDYELYDKLQDELSNWAYFYSQLGQTASLFFSAKFMKDEASGRYYYEGTRLFHVGLSMTGVPESQEGITKDNTCLFTQKDDKVFFCDAGYQPIFATPEQVEQAKRDFNMMLNIGFLFEGYPVEWCQSAQRGVLAEEYNQYYQSAMAYAGTAERAIQGNSPDNIEYKPMPKAGGMNGSLKSQALAIEKSKGASHIDAIVTSDSWEVQKDALGNPIRRVVYGYSIVQTDMGKRANRVSWAQDYQGGSYGKLHAYGVGMESFYVK